MAMKRAEKKELVRDLLASVEKSMCEAIDEGFVPEEWNGLELREWMAQYVRDNVAYLRLGRRQKAELNNWRLIYNL